MSITVSDKLELILKNYWIIKDEKGLVEGTSDNYREYQQWSPQLKSLLLNLLKPNAC